MSNRGFSILEVLLAMAIFMAGMLGVTALQISSTKGAAFSGNLSEASFLASNKLEELMQGSFADVTAGGPFESSGIGRNQNFTVRWTVDDMPNPNPSPNPEYKIITVFCEWKNQTHTVEFNGIRSDIN